MILVGLMMAGCFYSTYPQGGTREHDPIKWSLHVSPPPPLQPVGDLDPSVRWDLAELDGACVDGKAASCAKAWQIRREQRSVIYHELMCDDGDADACRVVIRRAGAKALASAVAWEKLCWLDQSDCAARDEALEAVPAPERACAHDAKTCITSARQVSPAGDAMRTVVLAERACRFAGDRATCAWYNMAAGDAWYSERLRITGQASLSKPY